MNDFPPFKKPMNYEVLPTQVSSGDIGIDPPLPHTGDPVANPQVVAPIVWPTSRSVSYIFPECLRTLIINLLHDPDLADNAKVAMIKLIFKGPKFEVVERQGINCILYDVICGGYAYETVEDLVSANNMKILLDYFGER